MAITQGKANVLTGEFQQVLYADKDFFKELISHVWIIDPVFMARSQIQAGLGYGVLKFQRALSFLGSNLASVGVLLPTAVRARDSSELGTAFGMIR